MACHLFEDSWQISISNVSLSPQLHLDTYGHLILSMLITELIALLSTNLDFLLHSPL